MGTTPNECVYFDDFKSQLTDQTLIAASLLDRYISLHNKRLNTAGSFISLFKKIDFQKIYEEINDLFLDFDDTRSNIQALYGNYGEYTYIQQEYYDIFETYFTALFDAVKILHVLANRQVELSKGLAREKLTLQENLSLEKTYQENIKVYRELGEELNLSFEKLKNEAIEEEKYQDIIDNCETKLVTLTISFSNEPGFTFYTFPKNIFKSDEEIDKLYDLKISFLIGKRSKIELSESESKALEELERLKSFDPRHRTVCYGLKEEVMLAAQIAYELQELSDIKFVINEHTTIWNKMRVFKSICRVLNSEFADEITRIVNLDRASTSNAFYGGYKLPKGVRAELSVPT